MKEQAPDKIVKTKKEIVAFLLEREEWYINYGNPFEEATMVSYISRGLEKLEKMGLTDEDIVEMYPSKEDGELQFKLGEGA